MYFARVFASSSLTVPFGGIGMGPHTPVEPSLIFFTRYASASFLDLYLAATSLYAGPTSFLSTVWQLRQAFSFKSSCASAASEGPLAAVNDAVNTAAAGSPRRFMEISAGGKNVRADAT